MLNEPIINLIIMFGWKVCIVDTCHTIEEFSHAPIYQIIKNDNNGTCTCMRDKREEIKKLMVRLSCLSTWGTYTHTHTHDTF